MLRAKRYPNRLGVKGWVAGGRWGVERYLYTLHRITGVGLLLYFLVHIIVTSARVFGPKAWNAMMDSVARSWIGYGEYLVFLAFAFHALNGFRLGYIEMFGGVGEPIEPIYPYKTSLNTQRPMTVALMLLVVIIIIAGSYDFFFLGSR